uniref:Dirigent protein n=1 Tax=Oncidium hybrid cultivar TaxID=141207 RepID=F5BCP4_ONCHC|nr:disease resistance response protein [Oncidium hybrid cultivar]
MASFSFSIPLFLAILLFLALEVSTATTTNTNEKETHLHFYLQERTKFPKSTVFKVAPKSTNIYNKSFNFGDIFVFDDLLTEGHDPKSRHLGRAQGTTTITSLDGFIGFNAISLVFTNLHPWTGSSLTLIGPFSFKDETGHLHVVGGTGRFQSARGYVVLTGLSSYDPNIGTYGLEVVVFNNN